MITNGRRGGREIWMDEWEKRRGGREGDMDGWKEGEEGGRWYGEIVCQCFLVIT